MFLLSYVKAFRTFILQFSSNSLGWAVPLSSGDEALCCTITLTIKFILCSFNNEAELYSRFRI